MKTKQNFAAAALLAFFAGALSLITYLAAHSNANMIATQCVIRHYFIHRDQVFVCALSPITPEQIERAKSGE